MAWWVPGAGYKPEMMSVTKLKQVSLSSLHSGTDQSCRSLLLTFFLMLIDITRVTAVQSERKAVDIKSGHI